MNPLLKNLLLSLAAVAIYNLVKNKVSALSFLP